MNEIREPKTIEELVCWVNMWGDLDERTERHFPEWRRGYEAAMQDVLGHAERLVPNWHETWRELVVA